MDSRVQKEIDTFIALGFEVSLIICNWESAFYKKENLEIFDVSLCRYRSPYGKLCTFLNIIKYWYIASRIIRKGNYSYIHCNDLDTLGVLYFLPKSYDKRIVYDAHELLPEMFPVFSIRRRIWNSVEKRLIKRVNTVITPDLNRAKYVRNKYKLLEIPYVINNFPRYQSVSPKDIKKELGLQESKKILCFHGRLGPDRQIKVIIESLKYLPDDFVLILIGYSLGGYDKYLRKSIESHGLGNRVFLYGRVPTHEILTTIAQCNVGIALYENSNLNNYYCASNKVFEYIMAGLKVIINDYPSHKMLSHYRFVRLIPQISPQTIAECARQLVNNNCSIPETIKRKFSWETFSDDFSNIYR